MKISEWEVCEICWDYFCEHTNNIEEEGPGYVPFFRLFGESNGVLLVWYKPGITLQNGETLTVDYTFSIANDGEPCMHMNSVEGRVLRCLCRYGLGMELNELTQAEIEDQFRIVRRLLDDNSESILCDAIQYGMPNVWPYSEGQAFTANDLSNKLLNAKAEAAVCRREGRIAYRPRP